MSWPCIRRRQVDKNEYTIQKWINSFNWTSSTKNRTERHCFVLPKVKFYDEDFGDVVFSTGTVKAIIFINTNFTSLIITLNLDNRTNICLTCSIPNSTWYS